MVLIYNPNTPPLGMETLYFAFGEKIAWCDKSKPKQNNNKGGLGKKNKRDLQDGENSEKQMWGTGGRTAASRGLFTKRKAKGT